MNEKLNIEKLSKEDAFIVRNLLQAYEAEFSKVTKKVPDENGIYPLDVDLSKYSVYLLRENKTPIGFALGNHDIADFYIVPTHRRTGAGIYLAKSIFEKYKGPWQARQIESYNLGRDFALGSLKMICGEESVREEIIEDPYWGTITIQYFESK